MLAGVIVKVLQGSDTTFTVNVKVARTMTESKIKINNAVNLFPIIYLPVLPVRVEVDWPLS